MSLSRALFQEFRPFFRLLEDPFSSTPGFSALARQGQALPGPFGGFGWHNRPALNLSQDEDGSFVVEAELPGVKKEDLNVKIGDGGRSLTIEGKTIRGRNSSANAPVAETSDTPSATPSEDKSEAVTKTEGTLPTSLDDNTVTDSSSPGDKQVVASNQPEWSGIRTFTRTVWLPQPINAGDVKAKLEDGVLTIRAAPAEQSTVNVNVD